MRAELHRQSILQMKVSLSCWFSLLLYALCYVSIAIDLLQINNRSIQDMHIFGDPSLVPVIIVDRILNAPRRATSVNSYLKNLDMIDSPKDTNILSGSGGSKNSRVLKIVVFVHGFQAILCSFMTYSEFLFPYYFFRTSPKFVDPPWFMHSCLDDLPPSLFSSVFIV